MSQQANVIPTAFLKQNVEFFQVEYDRSHKLYRIGRDIFYPENDQRMPHFKQLATKRNVYGLHSDIGSCAAEMAHKLRMIKTEGDVTGRLWRGALIAARYFAGEDDLFTADHAIYRRTATYYGKVHETFGRDYYHLSAWAETGRYHWHCSCPDHNKQRAVIHFNDKKQTICKHIFALMLAVEFGAPFKDIEGDPIDTATLTASESTVLYKYQNGVPCPAFYKTKFQSYLKTMNHAPANEEALISWIYN